MRVKIAEIANQRAMMAAQQRTSGTKNGVPAMTEDQANQISMVIAAQQRTKNGVPMMNVLNESQANQILEALSGLDPAEVRFSLKLLQQLQNGSEQNQWCLAEEESQAQEVQEPRAGLSPRP
jgi:hypothetical protein